MHICHRVQYNLNETRVIYKMNNDAGFDKTYVLAITRHSSTEI